MLASSNRFKLPRISRRRVLRFVLIAAGLWLIFALVLAAVVYVYGLTDRAEPADVILVLSSGLNRDQTPGAGLVRRATHAADLYREGYADMIICSGGYTTEMTRSEADGCAEVLQAHGVPPAAIILEEQSRSTEENALYSHAIMREHSWTNALIVSDGYHLLRATWIFSAEGISGSTSPASAPPPMTLVVSVGREVVALHWQVFKTALGLPVTFVPWL